MIRAPRSLAGPWRPVAVAGLLLLGIAGIVLVIGPVAFAHDPVAFDDAVLATGFAVLVGAALSALLARSPVADGTAERLPPAPTAGAGVARSTTPSGTIAPAPAPASSIPSSYVAAMYAPPADREAIADYSGPIAAALPFAAFPRPAGSRDDRASPEGLPALDVELARLRARIHELEADRDLAIAPPWFAARSGASRDLSPLASSSGGPVRPIAGGPSRCIGCGAAVAAQAPDPLCGNCGRPLCESCGGLPGPTAGLRRCPECAATTARTGAVSISGGRSAAGSGPDGPASPR